MTEERARGAKSVFHFDAQGTVGKSTHSGLPWLRRIRQQTEGQVYFWPFDGWAPRAGCSVVAEVYPALWNRSFPSEGRTSDQHDAWSVAEWLRRADVDGGLAKFLNPNLSAEDLEVAEVEGWILGLK